MLLLNDLAKYRYCMAFVAGHLSVIIIIQLMFRAFSYCLFIQLYMYSICTQLNVLCNALKPCSANRWWCLTLSNYYSIANSYIANPPILIVGHVPDEMLVSLFSSCFDKLKDASRIHQLFDYEYAENLLASQLQFR